MPAIITKTNAGVTIKVAGTALTFMPRVFLEAVRGGVIRIAKFLWPYLNSRVDGYFAKALPLISRSDPVGQLGSKRGSVAPTRVKASGQ